MRNQLQPKMSPRLERDLDEQPRAKCANDDGRELVDAVYARGYEGRHARRHLLILCSECPLQVSCWADPEWRDALKAAS